MRDGRVLFMVLLAAVVVVATTTRWIVCGLGLPYLHRWGEPNIAGLSLNMVKTGELNPHWFNYGSLTIYLHCLVDVFHYLWLSIQPAESMHHVESLDEIRTQFDSGWRWTISHPSFYYWNRVVTGLMGTGVVCITFVIGRAIAGRWTGLFAACLLAASVYHIEVSTTIRVDVPGSFWTVLVVALSLAYWRREKSKYVVAAFVLTGLAAATKYNLVLVGLVPLLALCMSRAKGESAYRPRLWAAAFLLPPLAFAIAMPYALLDFSTFIEHVRFEMEHYSIRGQGTRTVEAGLPHLMTQLGYLVDSVGWLPPILALLGLPRLAASRQGWLVLLFPLVFVAFMTRTVVAHEHNFIAVYPFLMISAACGVSLSHDAISRVTRTPLVPAMAGLFGAACVALALVSSTVIWFTPDTRTSAVQTINKLAESEGWERVLIVSQLRMHDEDFLRLDVEAERVSIVKLAERAGEFDAIVSPGSFSVTEGKHDEAEYARLSRRAAQWNSFVPKDNLLNETDGESIYLGRPAANPAIVIASTR